MNTAENHVQAAPVRPRLLIVDDIEENVVAFSAVLEDEDVEILSARSGAEALELLLRHEVALALVDVQMPEMDGYELAELMRGSSRTRQVPILFVTASASDSARVFRGYEAGGVDYLVKPIEPLVLRNKVRIFLQLHRQQVQLAMRLEELQRISVERQRLVDELSETLRLNELFLAALSHDLRSPLGAMITSAELLHRRSAEENTRRVAQRIRASGEAISGMLDSLLDLAQARVGGGLRLRVEAVVLDELVERVVSEQQIHFPGRQIEVRSEGTLRGVWEPARLHRLVSNLVGNALAHGSAAAPVRVELDGTGADEVRIRVRNGGAIPPEILPRLFDPFHTSTARHRGGLGLGLFSVRQIAQAHGGAVEVHTSAEEGTCVEVRLARRVEEAGERQAAVARA